MVQKRLHTFTHPRRVVRQRVNPLPEPPALTQKCSTAVCACIIEDLRLVLPVASDDVMIPLVGPEADVFERQHGRCHRAICISCGLSRDLSSTMYNQVHARLVSMSISKMSAAKPTHFCHTSKLKERRDVCNTQASLTSRVVDIASDTTTQHYPSEPRLYRLLPKSRIANFASSTGEAPICSDELNRWFSFETVVDNVPEQLDMSRVILKVEGLGLLAGPIPLKRSDLRVIAIAHGVFTQKSWSLPRLVSSLGQDHICTEYCASLSYIFKSRDKEYVPFRRKQLPDADPGAHISSVDPATVETSTTPVEVEQDREAFPIHCSPTVRDEIIREFEDYISNDNWTYAACAVCGQKRWDHELSLMNIDEVPLELLQNEHIPAAASPTTYDFELYERAFLCAAGMCNTVMRDDLRVCTRCRPSLERGNMPLDAIANFQYYGHEALPCALQDDFKESTDNERQLVAACRASRISYIYTASAGGNPLAPQRYVKGNVAIFPQEAGKVTQLIPPSPQDGEYSMCVIFLGGKSPTWETVENFRPVLVSRSRVERMARFLTDHNAFYKHFGMTFSAENLAQICSGEYFRGDKGVTTTVEVIHIEQKTSNEVAALDAVTSGYANTHPEEELGPLADPSRLVLHTVGFSSEEESWQHRDPTAKVALEWCRDRRQFLAVRTGDKLFPDRDPKMLSYLFPHLDPWGIGGFNNPLRESGNNISFERQLKNMLNMYDSRFEKDANFAYVCWNIIQRMNNSRASLFSIKESAYRDLMDRFESSADVVERMCNRWETDLQAEAQDDDEKNVLSLMNKLKVLTSSFPGSNASKLRMRNEIRALIKANGTPALFVTLNPGDVLHVLPHILAGRSAGSFLERNALQRAKLLAKNPAAAARFFDIMIRGFIDKVLRYGDDRPGLFGVCDAYYGTVEAQGRGGLHCHMLLWIKGNPNPQRLRDRMRSEPEFKASLFAWLESIISCELPGTTEVWVGNPEKLERPARETDTNPCSMEAPSRESFGDDAEGARLFQENFNDFVRMLAIETNWHKHSPTCWKYLKPNEPRNSQNCRMRMDGSVQARTEMDEETGAIRLRRLHPWINNFNDLMLYLFKCNHDVKYIGSGQDAKALVYYVTDYLTKSTLPTYAALGAICAAIKRTHAALAPNVDRRIFRRSLLTRITNGMMGRLELSHQQVMAYLVGGGDHYTSHNFRTLHWGSLDKHIRAQEPIEGDHINDSSAADLDEVADDAQAAHVDAGALTIPLTENNSTPEDAAATPDIIIRMSKRTLTASSLVQDYRFRGLTPEFEALSVYDHVAFVECEPKAERKKEASEGACNKRKSGRTRTKRVEFSSDEHPKHAKYFSRIRRSGFTPVILGPTLPTRGRSDFEDEQWYRAMLILFKPWRTLVDLKVSDQNWKAAYDAYTFPPHLQNIINNIQVEKECNEARLCADTARRAGQRMGLLAGMQGVVRSEDDRERALLAEMEQDPNLDSHTRLPDPDDLIDDPDNAAKPPLNAMDLRTLESIHNMERAGVIRPLTVQAGPPTTANIVPEHPALAHFIEPNPILAKQHEKTMRDLKKNKRPVRAISAAESDSPEYYPTSRWNADIFVSSLVDGSTPDDIISIEEALDLPVTDPARQRAVLEELLKEEKIVENKTLHIPGNKEQEIAIRLVCEHALYRRQDQMLAHISGVGGTGKSHVIQTISKFFSRTGKRAQLLLSAPTGIAAVLIGGYTIHALTFLPNSSRTSKRDSDLRDVWADVQYLVIDEVSMLSADFLSQISNRIAQAKGAVDIPYGRVNVIFTGDFGQLKPVRGRALYDPRLSRVKDTNQGQTRTGQSELDGVHLWRQLTHVVCLKKNMRQSGDPEYAALNARVRMGQPILRSTELDPISDYRKLYARSLDILSTDETAAFRDQDCPIIVTDRAVRDAVNLRVVHTVASDQGKGIAYLCARDRIASKVVGRALQVKLRELGSSHTEDLLGHLPYFPGMKVMITENTDMAHMTVNGSPGVLLHVKYDMVDGDRIPHCAYVYVPDCDMTLEGLPERVVPFYPISKRFEYRTKRGAPGVWVTRSQLPLLPAYSYTDYKSQGRSLERAIVDIASCRSLQSMYVMLSRVKTFKGLAILRRCPAAKFAGLKCTPEAKAEFRRIENLHTRTVETFEREIAVRFSQTAGSAGQESAGASSS